jgi:UDP:flavonoid glycosyltransferase YjiC (YdhE family)
VGYGVRLVVTRDFAEWVSGCGLDTHLLPVDKYEVMKRVSSQTNPLRVMLAIRREIAPGLLEVGRDLLSIAGDTAVLVVNEWTMGIASGIAEIHDLKMINMAMQPRFKTGEMPISTMPALPDWAPLRESYNRLTYYLAYTSRWWSYGRIENRFRRKHLKLSPLSPRDYWQMHARTPSITLVSRYVIPRPQDWDEHHRLTGFLFYDDNDWRPPSDLLDFIAAGKKPVFVGFGSMHDDQPLETTCLILEALERSNQRAVLQRGWADLGQVDLPVNVYRLDYAPHSWLFPKMAAVVHHAGAGTSAAALRAGVPSVPIPHSGDQFFWARRLHQLGAGTQSLPRGQLKVVGLASRITNAIADSQLKRAAADLGDKIRTEDGIARTISAIAEVLRKG